MTLSSLDLISRSRAVADTPKRKKNWMMKAKPERKAKAAKGEDQTRNSIRELRKRRSPLYAAMKD